MLQYFCETFKGKWGQKGKVDDRNIPTAFLWQISQSCPVTLEHLPARWRCCLTGSEHLPSGHPTSIQQERTIFDVSWCRVDVAGHRMPTGSQKQTHTSQHVGVRFINCSLFLHLLKRLTLYTYYSQKCWNVCFYQSNENQVPSSDEGNESINAMTYSIKDKCIQ